MEGRELPLSPPAPTSFEPVFLSEDDVEDLSSFTGMSREECRERLRSYTLAEHAEAWERADPKTPEELLDFYRSTDLYVWELMQWHASAERLPYWEALSTFAARFSSSNGYRRVYDFGCGVGTDGLFLALRGYEVTLVDVGGPAFRFAQHRFERRGLSARFVESRSSLPEPTEIYDAAVCFDVFEHLPDPLVAARRLISALRPDGILLQEAAYERTRPCHLTEGIRRFGGLRWYIHLAGLGLRTEGPLLYRKVTGFERLARRAAFELWRRTGLWVIHVGKSSDLEPDHYDGAIPARPSSCEGASREQARGGLSGP